MQQIIRQYLIANGPRSGGVEFSDDDSLLESGIVDSMMMVDLVVFLEKQCGLKIDEDDMTPENFDSVNAIADFVQRKMACR